MALVPPVRNPERLNDLNDLNDWNDWNGPQFSLVGTARGIRICDGGKANPRQKGSRRAERNLCRHRQEHQSEIAKAETVVRHF
jgi:hypothetical protein